MQRLRSKRWIVFSPALPKAVFGSLRVGILRVPRANWEVDSLLADLAGISLFGENSRMG
jgi:hypothetical protein